MTRAAPICAGCSEYRREEYRREKYSHERSRCEGSRHEKYRHKHEEHSPSAVSPGLQRFGARIPTPRLNPGVMLPQPAPKQDFSGAPLLPDPAPAHCVH